MKLYEYQVKEIFSKYGINIQKGKLAKTPQEAKQIAAAIGVPVVLKSQVLVEGRGKAGGVKIVDDLSDDSMYCVNCLGEIAEANNVYVDVLGVDDTTSSVILTDDSIGEGNYSYYIFLNKFNEDVEELEYPQGFDIE